MKISILIFEDNDHLRDSVTRMLQSIPGFEVVGAYPNCLDVKEKVNMMKPDLILMDVDMPGMSGIEGVKQIRSFNQSVSIIMLTVFDDNSQVYEAICAGASGYLLKRHIADKLVTTLYEVLEGHAFMSAGVAKMAAQSMFAHPNSKSDSNPYHLAPVEKEVLSSLASGNSQKLVASELRISIDTVSTHVRHIYEKLQSRPPAENSARPS